MEWDTLRKVVGTTHSIRPGYLHSVQAAEGDTFILNFLDYAELQPGLSLVEELKAVAERLQEEFEERVADSYSIISRIGADLRLKPNYSEGYAFQSRRANLRRYGFSPETDLTTVDDALKGTPAVFVTSNKTREVTELYWGPRGKLIYRDEGDDIVYMLLQEVEGKLLAGNIVEADEDTFQIHLPNQRKQVVLDKRNTPSDHPIKEISRPEERLPVAVFINNSGKPIELYDAHGTLVYFDEQWRSLL